ncbi:MAG: hypothetical protein ACYS30_26295 [Planctomycetota bacterium]|jgi:hypothetical protein
MMSEGTPETKKETQVSHQCTRLQDAATRLESICDALGKKLGPVLTPEPPIQEAKGEKESLCGLANTLHSLI